MEYTHVPKTGGVSLRTDLATLGISVGHLEFCFETAWKAGAFNFVLLRSPRAHVLSQFLECKYDAWGREVTSHLPQFPFPRAQEDAAGFSIWVEHFWNATQHPAGLLPHDFNCYSPLAFQTRQLGSDCVRPHHVHRRFPVHLRSVQAQLAAQLPKALARLEQYSFVGVTDLYAASWCLLLNRLREDMPAFCFDAAAKVTLTHEVHSVPRHKESDFSDATWARAEALAGNDARLFAAAFRRFAAELRRYQRGAGEGRRIGTHLLPRLKLLRSLAYLPELRGEIASLGSLEPGRQADAD